MRPDSTTGFRIWQILTPASMRYLQIHLLAEWFNSRGDDREFSGRGSQDLSNDTNFASSHANFSFSVFTSVVCGYEQWICLNVDVYLDILQ